MMRLIVGLLALFGALTGAGVAAVVRRARANRPAESTLGTVGRRERRSGMNWKRWLLRGTVLAAVLAAGGFLVAASGIVPIKASSGHWAITAWFLNFSSERSVSTHTIGMSAPPLDDPGLVLRGAGHYETACRPCHGSPVLPQPRVARGMTPPPPYLPPAIPRWEPEELFYIVKHGIKFTGMPAWPAQERDDEVWAMVAFLSLLPELDAAAYQRMVYGDAGPGGEDAPIHGLLGPQDAPPSSPRVVPPVVTENCGRCHGRDGLGRGPGAFPRLAGQRPAYLYAALQAYARGSRPSGIMEPVAAGLNSDEMRNVARYYGSLAPAPSPIPDGQDAAVARGREIARRGIPARRVPACAQCHGPAATPRNPFYPLLAGQDPAYLQQQLRLFQDGHRGGSSYAHLMHHAAPRLTEAEMRDVAYFYASLPGETGRP